MRTILFLTAAIGLTAVAITLPTASGRAPASPPAAATAETSSPLIVHEWGTFTSVSGSDGVRLEFAPLVDDDLPDFVLNRAWQSGIPNPAPTKLSYRAFQRMETPVTYFYTDREQKVRVKVGFPKGLLTEFYPPVAAMKPAFNWEKRAEIRDSELDWGEVTLIPQSHLRTHVADPALQAKVDQRLLNALLPPSHENHYGFARETDSALVHVHHQTADRKRPHAPAGDYFEKFLFYRGLANFSMPLSVTSPGRGEFQLTNTGTEPVRSLFLVTVHEKDIWFRQYDQILPGGRMSLEQSAQKSSIEELSEAVVKALMNERLYEKEARSMVKTWTDSWFQEEGTRLFYMLPANVTEELLPLTIEPRPAETVRVMVGRMEIMTPEDEARITSLVKAHMGQRAAAAKKRQEALDASQDVKDEPAKLPPALLEMGRLAEPALVRVRYFTKDREVQNEARMLLNELHAHWEAQAK